MTWYDHRYLPTLRLKIETWCDVSFKWQYGDFGTDAAIQQDCDKSIISVPEHGKYEQEELHNVQVDIHGCLKNSASVLVSKFPLKIDTFAQIWFG